MKQRVHFLCHFTTPLVAVGVALMVLSDLQTSGAQFDLSDDFDAPELTSNDLPSHQLPEV